jgi:hypothetical protein
MHGLFVGLAHEDKTGVRHQFKRFYFKMKKLLVHFSSSALPERFLPENATVKSALCVYQESMAGNSQRRA